MEVVMPSIYAGEEEMLAVLDVLALSDEAMFAIDDRHRIIFWNRGACALLEYTHDEVAGRSCSSVLAGSDHFGNRYCTELCAVQTIARAGGSVRPFRQRYRAKSGAQVPVDVLILKFTMPVSKRMLLAHILTPMMEEVLPVVQPPRASGEHADARVRELTSREIEILGRLAAGQSSTTIAEDLSISRLTARNHIQHIFAKLEVHSRSEAVAFAYRMRLVAE
jgi:PAS domain S-box-containing protein